MKTKLTLALVALITSSAFGGIPKVLPEFKNEKQLAEWRDEMAAKHAANPSTSDVRCSTLDVPSAFYTGKPYIASTGSYAFKYRSYKPELARWTSEDPSGFPDGANHQVFVPAPSFMFDPNGLAWETYYQWSSRSWETVTLVIIETNTSISMSGVNVGIGIGDSGPTGTIIFRFDINTTATEISRNTNTELLSEYSMDPPTGGGWQKDGDYKTYSENTQESRIENNTPLGNDRFRNRWDHTTSHVGYNTWKKWVE